MTWHVIKTLTRQEQKAVLDLKAAGHEAFTPAETVWRRNGTSKVKHPVQQALMPGYAFARDPSPHSLAASKNIVGVIMTGNARAILDQSTIDQLQRLSAAIVGTKALQAGSRVNITSGSFSGQQSIITEIKGYVATLHVELLGKTHTVKLPLAVLDAE
jgi:transcription antitermination factor NusG